MAEIKLTAAMEDYMETIYLLESRNKVARVSDIGKSMNVRKASVVSAVNNLRKLELIAHEKYGYISLTDKGKKTAEGIYRKHKILLEFLGDILKIDPERAKEEACSIEHALSQDTIDKLAVFIKNCRSSAPEKIIKEKNTAKRRKVKKDAKGKNKPVKRS